jgi:hypothetical protein
MTKTPSAASVIFGIFLNGHGRTELRNPELEPSRRISTCE